jgi:predicted component of type VI protein secretion system
MKLSLVVADGVHKGKVIPITLAQFLIGRDPSCQLRPSSNMISKRHCAILVRGSKVVARDLNSTNGCFVNEERLEGEVELHDGDFLRVGPLQFNVSLEGVPAVDKPTPIPDDIPAVAADPENADASDDAIADMLLDLPADEVATPDTVGEDPVPSGSTVLDALALNNEEKKAGEKEKPGAKKPGKPNEGNTGAAAKAILEKYMRRTRN